MSNSKTQNSLFFYGKEKCVCRVFPICVKAQYCEFGHLETINKMLHDYYGWSVTLREQVEKKDLQKSK